MKPIIIYHDNCADGFGAAFAAWLKFGDEAEYWAVQYGKDDPIGDPLRVITDREVYVLDFSFPKHIMDALFSVAKRVVWLDHHKTAFEMWCGGIPEQSGKWYSHDFDQDIPPGCVVRLDNNKSGAMIAWEYFHPEKEVPMLIKHIDDYDRWIFAIEGTEEFNKALWSYAPWSFEQWSQLFHFANDYVSMLLEGAAILRAHDQNVQAVVKGAGKACLVTKYNKVGGVCFQDKGLAANCPPHLASDVGHQLANQSGTYGLLWSINKEGKCLCSLRSNGDYDVSAIAKAFGGGGHKNAAGFEVDIQQLLEWIND